MSRPDPTPADLADPLFEAIWQAIRRWDVDTPILGLPSGPGMYHGATGNDVMTILLAVRAALAAASVGTGGTER